MLSASETTRRREVNLLFVALLLLVDKVFCLNTILKIMRIDRIFY